MTLGRVILDCWLRSPLKRRLQPPIIILFDANEIKIEFRFHVSNTYFHNVSQHESSALAIPQPGDQGQHKQWSVMLLLGTLDKIRWEGHFTSVIFLFQTENPNLKMRKTSDNPSWWILSKVPDQESPRLLRSSKTRKAWEIVTGRRTQGYITTKYNMVS